MGDANVEAFVMTLALGAIADDFTGATDLANTWAKEGVKVAQLIGVPEDVTELGDAETVVVALKSRTAAVGKAVNNSIEALNWLRRRSARQIVFKYCSTFDSTPSGNIGPVADALADELGADFALVCPAFPANGRTVYQGHLFVGNALLSESSMKDHPLTPMRDANLVRLMNAQSRHEVGLVPLQHVQSGSDRIRSRIEEIRSRGARYAVIDAISDDDLRAIGSSAFDHPLVTGGSGIGMGLPENFRTSGAITKASLPVAPNIAGRDLVLAGSCSAATRTQIAVAKDRWPARKLNPDRIAEGSGEVEAALDWAVGQPNDTPILIYASDEPDEVARVQSRHGAETAGRQVELALGKIASCLSDSGFSRIVVAGGETSGAVVSALGIRVLRIGPEIAPGVPWTEAIDGKPHALALKSGNFGAESFFVDAFGMLP